MEEYKDRTVLVTGGTGFIGSHLVRRLVNFDANIIVIDDFSTGPRSHIEDIEEEIQLIESDMANVSRPLPGFSEIECVFHLAAFSFVPGVEQDPMTTHRANTTGTLRVLEIARRVEPDMVVMMGSSLTGSSTGMRDGLADSAPPSSLYAATKGVLELYMSAYVERFSVPGIVLRPSCVYGPRQHQDRGYTNLMSSLIRQVLSGQPPELPMEGEQKKDYIYVCDVVDALMLAGRATDQVGEGFDICSGTSISAQELLEMIGEVGSYDVKEPLSSEQDNFYRQRSDLDPEPAKQQLGFEANCSFKDGLEQTISWFEERV